MAKTLDRSELHYADGLPDRDVFSPGRLEMAERLLRHTMANGRIRAAVDGKRRLCEEQLMTIIQQAEHNDVYPISGEEVLAACIPYQEEEF